jgi:divalent metal cation (Fe/Co/Zn/Cd) transporter
VVIALAEKYMRSADPRFPVGRTRLETVGVVACAVIMTIATIEVIQTSLGDLYEGLAHGAPPQPSLHCLSCAQQQEPCRICLGILSSVCADCCMAWANYCHCNCWSATLQ